MNKFDAYYVVILRFNETFYFQLLILKNVIIEAFSNNKTKWTIDEMIQLPLGFFPREILP